MRRELLTTLATRAVLITLSAVTAILTARLLGPVERGQFFLALTTTGLGVQLFCLGLQSSNTYLVAGDRLAFSRLHANSLWVTGASALIVALAGIGAFAAGVDTLQPALLVLALVGIPPALYYLYASNLLLGSGQTDRFNRFELLARVCPLLLILAFASNASALSLYLAYVIASILVAMLIFRQCRTPGVPATALDADLLRSALRYGFRAYLVMLLGFLLARTPVILLGMRGEASEVGQLSVAIQIADVMGTGPATVAMLLFPRLVRIEVARERTFARWLVRVAAVMAPVCLAAAAVSDPLIPWVFGRAFEPAVQVMYALLPGVFFLALIAVMSQYLAAVGFPWSMVPAWVLGVCVSVVTGTLLIRDHGALGAAMGLSCGYATVFFCFAGLCLQRCHRALSGVREIVANR